MRNAPAVWSVVVGVLAVAALPAAIWYVDRDITIDLIWASGAVGKEPRANPIEGWRRVSDCVRLHTVQAAHIGLITDELPRLAEVMQGILTQNAAAGS